MDFRDDLEVQTFLFGEDEALDNITIDLIKEDNIECCVCLNNSWGVKLPNCNHFICPKCYYKIYYGYISDNFHINNPKPIYPVNPVYPYLDKETNKEIYYNIINDDKYLEWFMYDNQDLYNSVKINSEYVNSMDIKLKKWFENNKNIENYENNLIQYNKDLEQYYIDIEKYDELYDEEKEDNSQKICPLCRV